MTKRVTPSHPARSELAALLWSRRELIHDYQLASHDALVERSGVTHEYFIRSFDDAKDWRDMSLSQRVLRHQRIPRLPRSVYGPAYYMSRLVTNASAITAKSNLLDSLFNMGRGTT